MIKKVPKKYRGIHYSLFLKDGEKILVLTKIGEIGTEWQKKFSVKHLIDENFEVTKQTLDEEKKMFREPIRL